MSNYPTKHNIMSEQHQLKQELFLICQENINKRIATIEERLEAIKESKNNETKSSVGDKYETGRAMLQIEEDKSKSQLAEAQKVQYELSKINPEKQSDQVELGSLVTTNRGVYFIAIGVGQVKLANQTYFCVSNYAPIVQALRNKKEGDSITFNKLSFEIHSIQ